MATRSRKQPAFSVAEWISLNEAFDAVKAALRSRDLASRDLIEHMRSGQLASAARRIARDRSETFEHLKPSFWQPITMQGISTGGVRVHGVDIKTRAGSEIWFFVARRDFSKLYPAARAAADTIADTDTPTRPRPGPKPTGDWPTELAAWLIAVACDDPKRLQNVDALTDEARIFLREKIKWAPKETKELRRKIAKLLQLVRR
ncbi:hypothetical protein [Bradyrhizobium sp.]|jgi:hypothetical protein|uniref:hypothetical protein n=1 Tax=Bradyrhizobium sp. TaxID=376 RepID=UPI002D7FF466|nr:hypothetical protein [Bradyrhizobium sp.]